MVRRSRPDLCDPVGSLEAPLWQPYGAGDEPDAQQILCPEPNLEVSISVDVSGQVSGPVTVVAPAPVATLYQDDRVRRSISGLVTPLRDPTVSEFQVLEHGVPVETLTREEVEGLLPSSGDEIEQADDDISETARVAPFAVTRAIFEAGNRRWELSDGTNHYPVTMDDKAFMEKVTSGDHSRW